LADLPVDEQRTIAKLLAEKFIARKDVKAIQRSNGDYNPLDTGFDMASLLDHINGRQTYGHYMLNQDDQCKLFVFDIDLNKPDKRFPDEKFYLPTEIEDGQFAEFLEGNPREVWLDRTARVEREYMKMQMRGMAQMLAAQIHRQLEIPIAATYTGSKGVHVYGFTGLMKAVDVRDGAQLVLDSLGRFEPARGNHFFKHKVVSTEEVGSDHELSYDCLTIEVFPKQVSLDRKTHGNLVRLPLGRNLKNPRDPTFFLDFRASMGEGALTPLNPIDALTVKDYWA
jgi:hypothetical protein